MVMQRWLYAGLVLLGTVMLYSGWADAQSDVAGSADHPMFSRMPGYYISEYRQEEFATFEFADENCSDVTVEGQLTEIVYTLPDSAPRGAKLKILRNFTGAAARIGGKFCDYSDNSTYINIRKEGQEVWANIYATEDSYTVTIVQKGEVQQEITADWMLAELNRSGHVALYINFDTGKATIRPESRSVVNQVVALLRETPDLKIQIQGHTDDVGAEEANQHLSEQRAQAVMQAIIARGIAKERLTAAGFGENKPIADNATDAGRAKNRRVELVKM